MTNHITNLIWISFNNHNALYKSLFFPQPKKKHLTTINLYALFHPKVFLHPQTNATSEITCEQKRRQYEKSN